MSEPVPETGEQLVETQDQEQELPFYRKIDLPVFVAGIIAGILTLSNDAWWTLQGEGSSQIILFKVSPFYLQTLANGLPVTTPTAQSLGIATRGIVGLAALLLVVAAIKPTVWWKNIAQWYNISAVLEMFLSFTILLNTARQEALVAYGVSFPVSGVMTLPFSMLGLDFSYYANPTITAGFSFVFYTGLVCLVLVSFERFQNLRMFDSFRQMQIGTIRELTLAPPYTQVWAATDDKSLNPLSEDLDAVTDEKLVSSLTNMFQTVGPGGTVTILLPTWSAWIAEKIRGLVKWVGFQAEQKEIVDQEGESEVELKLSKPTGEGPTVAASMTENVLTEPGTVPPASNIEAPAQARPLPILQRLPARPSLRRKIMPHAPEFEQEVGPRPKPNKKEMGMVKSALKVISNYGVPVAYRELLNEVYLDLLQNHTEFESARAIEKVLLSHVGHELVLVEEESSPGHLVRKWWTGSEPPAVSMAQLEAIERLRAVSQMAESKIRGLKNRFQHHQGYHSRRKSYDEDSSSRT